LSSATSSALSYEPKNLPNDKDNTWSDEFTKKIIKKQITPRFIYLFGIVDVDIFCIRDVLSYKKLNHLF
jgi:hypothetical protein